MVLSMENSTEIASFHHTLFPYCWSHQVCSRPSFGLIKKAFKVTYVSSLYEFARLVETSSTTGLNKARASGCSCVRLEYISWAVLQKAAKH